LRVEEPPKHFTPSASRLTAEVLAARFQRRLLIFAVHHLGNRQDAEDLAQETLARVLAAMQKGALADPEALPAFVYQTARNVMKERFRKAGRETRAMTRYQHEPASEPGPDNLAVLVSSERGRELRAALATLAADDRNLLQWLYGQDLDAAEVAARLNIAAGNVRVRKHRALARLAAALGERGARHETNPAERQPDPGK